MTTPDMRIWHYFLMLERDFAATAAFVEPHVSNHRTFSDRYAGLLLLIGSEVDVVAKQLTKKIDPKSKADKIKDYEEIIVQRYPNLHRLEVDIPRYDLKIKPWESWGKSPSSSPGWWRAYNCVKHDRIRKIEMASQINALTGLCGLFLLNMYLNSNPVSLWPRPELLDSGYFPPFLVDHPDKTLPDL